MKRFHSFLRALGVVFALTLAVAVSGERAAMGTMLGSIEKATVRPCCESLHLSPADLEFLVGAGNVVLIDVRNPGAYAYAHLRGALSIPPDSLQSAVAAFRSSDVRIVTYGDEPDDATGLRAAETLRRLGLPNAQVLDGGLSRWVAEGNVVVMEPRPEF